MAAFLSRVGVPRVQVRAGPERAFSRPMIDPDEDSDQKHEEPGNGMPPRPFTPPFNQKCGNQYVSLFIQSWNPHSHPSTSTSSGGAFFPDATQSFRYIPPVSDLQGFAWQVLLALE